ncbi:MAG: Sjogren's syndrome/scleroderma autoantigen 1 family protein [Methanosarcina sp.]|uniref:Sjogren's syndrome/scleroderma autoantigen 1 family protein n=1 Tax=Methanosarcina sp. TaxID=2213 RepID=UPI00261484E2|nr:Sjogren's syndrome/scleroderma autoantigen 1 family protein [Methanosarcina sp.]MDD3246676.1 Sjogren's syndrome/scleroderma autoantigen 1 family protein [Methanosarcina sp.]
MDSDKDKKVKRIARFLELGGTMLAEHCKVCGAPKFRYQGTVICPICDVREENEETPAPEPAAEVQAPEARASIERDRSSLESRKKVQARRPKSRIGQRAPEAEEGEDEILQFAEEEISETPYEAEEVGRPVTEVPAARAGKRTGLSTVSTAHRDREVLENLLFKKMVSVAASLQDEKNPRSIAEQFDLIEKGIGLVERLRQV